MSNPECKIRLADIRISCQDYQWQRLIKGMLQQEVFHKPPQADKNNFKACWQCILALIINTDVYIVDEVKHDTQHYLVHRIGKL